MTVSVGLNRAFTVSDFGTLDDLDRETDQIMVELLALEGPDLYDSAVGLDMSTCTVEIDIVARGDNFDEALARADSAIRAAIHAGGGATPMWNALTVRQNAELVGS